MPNMVCSAVFNYTKPNWKPLERAVSMAGRPQSDVGLFMWMIENPEGVHQYKHRDTRNYAMLRADSTPDECKAELDKAFLEGRTWGAELDSRLGRA